MVKKDQILNTLHENKDIMKDKFGVRKIGLFGSYLRGESIKGSDIDLLVELDNPTFDHYMDLKFFLEDLFQTEVDLVLKDTLKPRLKPYIAREVLYA
jgi:hypothetical protein